MRVLLKKGSIDLENQSALFDYVVASSSPNFSGSGSFASYISKLGGAELKTVTSSLKNGEKCCAYIVPGMSVGVNAIVYSVTPTKGTSSLGDLTKCYLNCINQINDNIDLEGHSGNIKVAFSLLGTGKLGWTVEESLEAFWQSVLLFVEDYILEHNEPKIDVIELYLNNKGSEELISSYRNRRSQAFFNHQGGWGLRGDPGYWVYLMKLFDKTIYNDISLSQFIDVINHSSIALCEKPVAKVDCEYVKQFDRGGMSRGMISSYWIDKGIAMLCVELCKLGIDNEPKPIIYVSTTIRNESWQLPYTAVKKLQELIWESNSK